MHGYPKNQGGDDADKSAQQLVRDEFARRLYNLIVRNGITQAEVVRRSSGALSRDNVSTYVLGKVLPTPAKLAALAKALDVDPAELLPQAHEVLKQTPTPLDTFSFSQVSPGRVRLQVNKVVATATAMKVGQIINDDETDTAH